MRLHCYALYAVVAVSCNELPMQEQSEFCCSYKFLQRRLDHFQALSGLGFGRVQRRQQSDNLLARADRHQTLVCDRQNNEIATEKSLLQRM